MIKVAWICSVSNQEIRENVTVKVGQLERIIRKVIHNPISPVTPDIAVWNTYAFDEFKSQQDIELHVICPYSYLSVNRVDFTKDGITYHLFKNEAVSLFALLRKRLRKAPFDYTRNRRVISRLISEIDPDIVHLMGAENAFYSLSVLDITKGRYPVIAQLQTLVSDPNFEKNYPVSKKVYNELLFSERSVIERADYIGTKVEPFIKYIKENIKPDARFLPITLAVSEQIHTNDCEKTFDFVYFAVDISKASDWAIEAFAIVHNKYPKVHLNIVGGYAAEFKNILDKRIDQLGLSGSVVFSGKLPTHEDVINQIRMSKIALLPLKIDYTSGTIREAMANGIPVVTTITEGTPKLNSEQPCVLLSEKEDFDGMAKNMIRLLEDRQLFELLVNNSYQKIADRISNKEVVDGYVESYKNILGR